MDKGDLTEGVSITESGMCYRYFLKNVYVLLHVLVDVKRLEFMKNICQSTPVVRHVINRSKVYRDVMELLSRDQVLEEFPLQINFVNEAAIDHGGVCRDMFSAFWEEAYRRFFDGSTLLTPCMHANTDMASLPQLGRVLSHGYLVCGYFPIRVAFPCLAAILLNPTVDIPLKILVQTFAEGLNSFEAAIIKDTLATDTFSKDLQEKLISILSRYGSRVCPSPTDLKLQLCNIAKYEYQIKPMAAICSINSGIPPKEKDFWHAFTINQLYLLYQSLSATPAKVLAILEEPMEENSCQARVFTYLQQYIGNMKNEEVRRFLRYTTGSSVLIGEHITVSFNSLSGAARRPIAHTCGCELELSSSYLSYLEFEEEFNFILSNDEYTWDMDAA